MAAHAEEGHHGRARFHRGDTVVDRPPHTAADGPVPVDAPRAPSRAGGGSATSGRPLTRTWSVLLGVGWPLAVLASLALEPAPVDLNAPVPLVIDLATFAALAALVATSVTAGLRHRTAAVFGVVSGLLLTTFVVACPVSGHHAFGLWWYAELTLVVGMLGVSLAALGGRATGADPAPR